ncbi:MAG: DUF1311 domain-containing protein [Oscillospiraceae bacterium]|nr:DUF1311 domain-containing protein [Oscillospiraceae bacterium]
MTEFQILSAMTHINSVYIDAAQKQLGYLPKSSPKKQPRRAFRAPMAAAIAVVLLTVLFFQTPMGVKAAEIVQQKIAQLIEVLFPAKEIVVSPEGMTDVVSHAAHGKEPSATDPGFAIYVDEERYTMTQEDGAWFVRPIDYDPAWPPCELVIRELPGKDYETAAQEVRNGMLDSWKFVSGIYRPLDPPRMIFNANDGDAWEAPMEDHYFYENGNLGTYHIICRYFVGIAEGHGTRLAAMRDTFTIIAPQDASQYENEADAIKQAMAREAAYAQGLVDELLETLKTDATMTQADMNINSQRRYELWDEVLNKIWDALERTMDKAAFNVLKQEQLLWIDRKEAKMDDAAAEYAGGSLSASAYYGTGAEITERRVYELLEYLTGERTVGEVPEITAPAELIPGQSTSDDVSAYYQAKFPEKNIYCTFRDFDGNNYGDLAVYYDGCYRALYLMGEDYILQKEYLFEEGFRLYWNTETDAANILGTEEMRDTGSANFYYDIQDGQLILLDAIKFDNGSGSNQWFTIGDSDWAPMSKDLYGEILFRYKIQTDNLVPIEEYYLQ